MTAIPQAREIALDDLGNVPRSYRHEWRVADVFEPITVPGAVFKWYHVRREGMPVPTELDAEARAIIERAAREEWDLSYGLNFALLHVSTQHAFLFGCVWRGHQELWQYLYVKDLAQSEPFAPLVLPRQDHPNSCVWEMGVIHHERMAWHRYLFTERAEADKRAWLADTYTGRV